MQFENHIFKVLSGDLKTTLHTPDNSTGKLAVVLPGAGYTCKQPLLHYATQVLLQKNFPVLSIDQVYADNPTWVNLDTMEAALKVVEEDCKVLFPSIKEKFKQEIHTVLGRSLGTYMIACALESQALTAKQIVWQTPSLNGKWNVIKKCGIRGFCIIGTADERYETARPHLSETTLVIENADHAMEIQGDPLRSIEILVQVTRATAEWIQI